LSQVKDCRYSGAQETLENTWEAIDLYTPDEIIGEFPDLRREDIAACLDYARDLADYQVV
jgi:hypothetical protein